MADMPRTLGIDYGRRRIGLAVSDPTGTIAQPLRVVDAKNRGAALRALADVCREYEVDRIVVGVPLDADGGHGEMAQEVERWANELATKLNIVVERRDERLTSAWAGRVTQELGWSNRRARAESDALAAQAILDDYLQSLRVR